MQCSHSQHDPQMLIKVTGSFNVLYNGPNKMLFLNGKSETCKS